MGITDTRQPPLPARNGNAVMVSADVAARGQRWLALARSTAVAAWRHATASKAELNRAKRNLHRARQLLLEAESRFDRERGIDAVPLIVAIKLAEARVRACRNAVLQVDPWSTE